MKEKQYSTLGRAQTTNYGHIEIKYVCLKYISAIYQLCNFGKLLKLSGAPYLYHGFKNQIRQ